MSSDIYTKPNLGHEVRFNKKTEEDRSEWKEEEVYIYESADDIANDRKTYQLQDEEQQSLDQPEGKKKPPKRSTLCKTVLCIVVLAAFIALTTYVILENIKLNVYRQRLDGLIVNNSRLQNHLNQLKEEVKQMKNKAEEKRCPDRWTRFGCSCYFKSTERKSWSESRKLCQARGADLVIINSREEQKFVADLNQNGDSWIGLRVTLIGRDYEWRWVDGSPLTFWETGWPQYSSTYNWWSAAYCSYQGKWKPSDHTYQLNWICEK